MGKNNGHNDIEHYKACLPTATTRFNSGDIKTCPKGYCTAKAKYEVYPSAYANGYASSVCQGLKPDFTGETSPNEKYMERINKLRSGEIKQKSNMGRWFNENWVNVCEPKVNGEYQPCGRHNADLEPSSYPYCRPEKRIDSGTPMTVGEIIEKHGNSELSRLCKLKRSHKQGVNGLPYYLRTDATIIGDVDKKVTIDYERLTSAVAGKLYKQGGLNLPEFKEQTTQWIFDNLDDGKITALGKVLGFSGDIKSIKNHLKQDILVDTRKSLEGLTDQLGISKPSSKFSNKGNKSRDKKIAVDPEDTEPDMDLVDQYNPLKACARNGLYHVSKSTKGKKKLNVDVIDKDGNPVTVHFGHSDYQDFTKHRDTKRRDNYCKRSGGIKCSKGKDGVCDQSSANFWSRSALWDCDVDKADLCKSVTDKKCKKHLKC